MQKKQSHKVTPKEKIRFIQDLLTGVIDITKYRPPKMFYVTSFEPDVYKVSAKSGRPGATDEILMNEEQYQNWKASLREDDTLFVLIHRLQEGNDPLDERTDRERSAEYESAKRQHWQKEVPTIAEETAPRKRAKNTVKNDPIKTTEETQLFALPVKKTFGKLSEYGDSWKVSNNEN